MARNKAAKAQSGWLDNFWPSLAALAVKQVNRFNRSNEKRPSPVTSDPAVEEVDGCIFMGASGWKLLVRLNTTPSYFTKPAKKRQGSLAAMSLTLRALTGKSGRLYITHTPYNVEKKRDLWNREAANRLKSAQGAGSHSGYRQMLDRHTRYLRMMNFRVRVLWLEIDLDDHRLEGDDSGLTAELYEYGVTEYGIQDPGNHRFIPKIDRVMKAIRGGYGTARPAMQTEVLNHIVQANWRGIEQPPEPNFDPRVPFNKPAQLAWLGHGFYWPNIYNIENICVGRNGFVSYLVLSGLPDDIEYSGLEFLAMTDQYGQPVAMTVEFKVLTQAEAIQEMEKRQANLTGWLTPATIKRGDHKQSVIPRATAAMQTAKAKAERDQEGHIKMYVVAAVPGRTAAEAEDNALHVIGKAARLYPGVVWDVPAWLQGPLHESCIPGNDWQVYTYPLYPCIDGLAAGGAGVTDVPLVGGRLAGRLSGRDRGPLEIGITSTLTKGQEGATLVVAFGTPGSGKTSWLIDEGLGLGHSAIFLYREGTHTESQQLRWQYIPDPPHYEIIDVSRDPGCFNAAWWGKTPGEHASNLTSFLYSSLLAAQDGDRQIIFDYAMDYILSKPNHGDDQNPGDVRDFRELVAIMRGSGDNAAVRIAQDLREMCELPGTKIYYGTYAQAEALFSRFKDFGFYIWRNSAWTLPDPTSEPKNWTAQQRMAVAGIGLQYPFSQELSRRRGVVTVVADDEFHATAKLPGGYSNLFDICNTGRKYDAIQVIGTPSANPDVVPTWCRQFASWVVVFRALTDQDAIWSLEYLGVEDPTDPVWIENVKNLGLDRITGLQDPNLQGECYIKDPTGAIRKGVIGRLNLGPHGLEPRDTEQHVSAPAPSIQTGSLVLSKP